MVKKYLETKKDSLESSILGVWKNAAAVTEESAKKLKFLELDLNEDKMSQLHQYIKDGKTVEEIAKLMKIDVNTVKSLMNSAWMRRKLKEELGLDLNEDDMSQTRQYFVSGKARRWHLDQMSKLHQYIKAGKTVQEIAKLMKIDVKMVRELMNSAWMRRKLKEELGLDLNEVKMSKMEQLFQYIRDGKKPEEIVKRMKDQWPRINIDVNTVKSLIKSIPANVYYVDGHPYLRHPMLGAYAYNEEKEKEGDKEKYVKFFDTAMKKFGINSPADLKSDEQKKEFYDYVDKNYKGDHEESLEKEEFIKKESYEIGTNEYRDHTLSVTPGQEDPDWVKLQRFKVSSMKEALAKIWGLKEKKLDKASKRAYEEEDENLRPVKGSKTMTGGKIAKVDITPKID